MTVSGGLVLLSPLIYFLYDRFCKPEDVNPSESLRSVPAVRGDGVNFLFIFPALKNISQVSVILYLLTALAWALLGFLWIFGARQIENQNCGHDSHTYWVGSELITRTIVDLKYCFSFSSLSVH